jgi:hypothetical protein
LFLNGSATSPLVHVEAHEGDQFVFKARMRATSGGGTAKGRLLIQFRTADGSAAVGGGNAFSDTLETTSTSYQELSVSHTAPAGTGIVVFSLRVPTGGTASPRFDDLIADSGADMTKDHTVIVNYVHRQVTWTADAGSGAFVTGDPSETLEVEFHDLEGNVVASFARDFTLDSSVGTVSNGNEVTSADSGYSLGSTRTGNGTTACQQSITLTMPSGKKMYAALAGIAIDNTATVTPDTGGAK